MTRSVRLLSINLRVSVFALFVVVVLLSGCTGRRSDEPIVYSHVNISDGGSDGLGEPFGIAIKGDDLYVSDGSNGSIRRIRAGISEIVASGLSTPSAIAFLPDGDLLVADTGTHTIRKISLDGSSNLFAGTENVSGASDGPVAASRFNAPVGLAVGEDGTVYVSDTYNDRIRMVKDGVVTTLAGERRGFADGVGSSASFDTPLGIAVLGDRILVADSGNARVRVVEPSGVVGTLAGGNERDLINGTLGGARFVDPTAITVDDRGSIFVADGNAIRVIGRRAIPVVETIAGDTRGFTDGLAGAAQFNRPSGLAIGSDRRLYIADSDNRSVRVITNQEYPDSSKRRLAAMDKPDEPYPLATRWPFDPGQTRREVAGTLGEIRGEVRQDDKPVWFHNGLDIAGAYGELTRFIRDETVLDPHSAQNFGTARELLRLPLIGYIHLRLGRDKSGVVFNDPRFQFDRDPSGKLTDLRIRRGTRFSTGDAIGTLNSMNHVHLIAGRSGEEFNALAALQLPGISDSIAPVIERVTLVADDWVEIKPETGGRVRLLDRVRVIVRAYDRMDGNSERRKLGVYRVGYQFVSNGSPVGELVWPISFARMPSNDAVRFAYAPGSQSGYSPNTIFDYIATNRVDGYSFAEGFLDTSGLTSGDHTLRVFATDYFGNVVSKDVAVVR